MRGYPVTNSDIIVLALGRRGTPSKLGVRGEELSVEPWTFTNVVSNCGFAPLRRRNAVVSLICSVVARLSETMVFELMIGF
jgi:hypothetical protein